MTRLSLFATMALTSIAIAGCSREAEAPIANAAKTADEANVADGVAGNDTIGGNAVGTMQSVDFVGGDGAALGSIALSDGAGGLTMVVSGKGMPAGVHGIHLHEKGLCDGPKFTSAGAHWNPAGTQHGRDNPRGPHLGDLANLEVTATGDATASFTIPGAAMREGSASIADADGTAIVVHAKADNYKTDPSGDSGDRIACAVVAAPE